MNSSWPATVVRRARSRFPTTESHGPRCSSPAFGRQGKKSGTKAVFVVKLLVAGGNVPEFHDTFITNESESLATSRKGRKTTLFD